MSKYDFEGRGNQVILSPLWAGHVQAIGTEGLHSKTAIAIELAWRDMQIEKLQRIIKDICDPDNMPNYHSVGMGCGLEDRNITDRYDAMAYGWEQAIERVQQELLPDITDLGLGEE